MAITVVHQLTRLGRTSVPQTARLFSTTGLRNKDFVRELYIKELKSYKAPPTAADAHVGAVKTINVPQAPHPPQVPTDLASELQAYSSSEPAAGHASASTSSSTVGVEGESGGADAFLHFLEQDLPKQEAHH